MKLYYYYSDGCSCCKGYDLIVDKVAGELGLPVEHIDLSSLNDVNVEPLEGVPCVIIRDGDKMVYKHVGNLKEDYLLEELKKVWQG